MNDLSLQEYIQASKTAVAANKAKGNKHAEILTQLYSEPNRFIDEILQNAEDAYHRNPKSNGDKTIRFCLFNDRLEIFHNGKPFDVNDLKSITTFANTTKNKTNEINLIGKFGIGFKSVFGICTEPEIHSGGFHFKIKDYEVLEESKPAIINGFTTLFVLPFKKENSTAIFKNVKKGLANLNSSYLLFLNEICKIEVFVNEKNILNISKSTENIEAQIKKVHISYTNFKKENENFLVLFKNKALPFSAIEIAFKLEKEEIVPIHNPTVFVYFPTKHYSDLNFIIHGSYTTTPTREFIPFDKSKTPENLAMIEETASLLCSNLRKLKNLNYLKLSFYEVLPIISAKAKLNSSYHIYEVFYNSVLKTLKEKNLLPTIDGHFSNPKESIIAETETLSDFLQSKDLEVLFGKKNWLHKEINRENHPAFFEFLTNQLGVKVIDINNFGFRLAVNSGFLKTKKDSWFIKFYGLLSKNPQLWNKENESSHFSLRKTPILLNHKNQLIPLFDKDGNLNIILTKSLTRKGNRIKTSLFDTVEVQTLFKELIENIHLEQSIDLFKSNKADAFENDDEWEAEIEPNAAPIDYEETNQSISKSNKKTSFAEISGISNQIGSLLQSITPETKSKIAIWSEAYIFKVLKSEYGNDESIIIKKQNSEGLDFAVLKNNEIVKYVSIVSKALFEREFKISKQQIEAAVEFFQMKKQELHWFYCVSNAGTTNVRIFKFNKIIERLLNNSLNLGELRITV
ncbi:MAG: hypothetical protein HXX09_12490 [Bacteroidetes bacterium]|nr:hypothetical protein [Bacteroidota bacterium]